MDGSTYQLFRRTAPLLRVSKECLQTLHQPARVSRLVPFLTLAIYITLTTHTQLLGDVVGVGGREDIDRRSIRSFAAMGRGCAGQFDLAHTAHSLCPLVQCN